SEPDDFPCGNAVMARLLHAKVGRRPGAQPGGAAASAGAEVGAGQGLAVAELAGLADELDAALGQDVADVGQAQGVGEVLLDAGVAGLAFGSAIAGAGADLEIVADVEAREDPASLGDEGDAPTGDLVGRAAVDASSVEADLTSRHGQGAGDDAQRCGLARA